jgi:hypothetical protein
MERSYAGAQRARASNEVVVESVDVRMDGVEIRLRPNGLAGLLREVAGSWRAVA